MKYDSKQNDDGNQNKGEFKYHDKMILNNNGNKSNITSIHKDETQNKSKIIIKIKIKVK